MIDISMLNQFESLLSSINQREGWDRERYVEHVSVKSYVKKTEELSIVYQRRYENAIHKNRCLGMIERNERK